MCLVSLIVYKTDAFEKEQRHTTAQLNAATYGERIKNEIVNGTEITDTLEQILISDDGTIKHFNTIAKNLMSGRTFRRKKNKAIGRTHFNNKKVAF